MSDLPRIIKNEFGMTFLVDGNPFYTRAGEIHNSSASDRNYMEKTVWPALRGHHLNSLIAPVYWECVEPEEGKFDYTLVDSLLEQARREQVRLEILWFGLWKNSASDYVPQWVKKNTQRFWLVRDENGKLPRYFTYGGVSGRFVKQEQFNSKGEPLNYWDVARDYFVDRDGNASLQESMWRYVVDIQRDFAARVEWAGTDCPEKGEHPPKLEIAEGLDFFLCPGQSVTVHAVASEGAVISFRLYEDAGAACALQVNDSMAVLTVPTDAVPGEKIHVIVKAQLGGHHRLSHYQQVVLRVK